MAKQNNGTRVRFRPGSDPEAVRVDSISGSPARYRAKYGCLELPIMFERAGSWWPNPKFDSDVLETEQWSSYFPQARHRFQYALFYILAACVAWAIFFGVTQQYARQWPFFLVGTLILFGLILLILIFTYTNYYEKYYLVTSIFVSCLVGCSVLLTLIFENSDLSTIGAFTSTVEVLLMMYSVIPMPLFLTVSIGLTYSVVFEVLTALQNHFMQAPYFLAGKILLHLCIHLMGIHIFIMRQVRQRSTFWKIGQSVIARKDLQLEKQIKEKMIHSLMPPSVAVDVMRSREDKDDDDMDDMRSKKRNSKTKTLLKGEIIFRPFNMNQMIDVSILFADIVGFTKMSSNKTAEVLVGQLNDLFGRFDDLCSKTGCEKISTLGDCYYCVAGCPEPKPDHAVCCVEMGLGMIDAIQKFDEENKEEVNMRVGVHTGTVLCGIVGTRRFKFDVWSNDVTLANTMESTGMPGRVHISNATLDFLKDQYNVDDGPEVEDNRSDKKLVEEYDKDTSQYAVKHAAWDKTIKTYFIVDRKKKTVESPVDNDADAVKPDTVVVAMEAGNTPTESDGLINDTVTSDRESVGANGITTALVSSHLNSSVGKLDDKEEQIWLWNVPSLIVHSMADRGRGVEEDFNLNLEPMNETWTKIRNINYHTDMHIVKCIQEGITNKEYFYKPPINKFTLAFSDPFLEETYRDHYVEEHHQQHTLSAPKYSSFLESLVSFLVFTIVSVFCFVVFDLQLPWIIFFAVAFIVEFLNLMFAALTIKYWDVTNKDCWRKLTHVTSGWKFRNVLGAVVASCPVLAVYANFSCVLMSGMPWIDRFLCFCIVVSLLHYTNFTTLSSWMKSTVALLAGAALIVMLTTVNCFHDLDTENTTMSPTFVTHGVISNITSVNITIPTTVAGLGNSSKYTPLFYGVHILQFEIILDMLLLVLLITFLNRESEISSRLNYHGDMQAWEYKQIMQENKDQADWLLHNIIPQHVSDVVRKTSKYSKNHKDVGVIFAAIVNFNEIYDETFEGGREFLRVLNELVSDYEELLDDIRFKDVEKIKTISSTFMAASGLNEISRSQNKNPNAHLYALMEFSTELHKAIKRFNDSIFNFDFILNIGFNYGEVTAGVIGTTKLLYDIWGDTVNIASRMYSTGVKERIQVPEATAKLLGDKMDFEYRGEISVKGKGHMQTFLLQAIKEGAQWTE